MPQSLIERVCVRKAPTFLDTLQRRVPFSHSRAVQVDGGSEFAAEFEQASKLRGLHVFCAASAPQTLL